MLEIIIPSRIEIIIPSILLASPHENGNGINDDESDFTDEMNEGLSDNSQDRESIKEAKDKIRSELKEYQKIKDRREELDREHTQAGDDSNSEAEEEIRKKSEKVNILMKYKREFLHELKDPFNMKKRDSRDRGDDSRRGGPSAGTTGGPPEGTGGSSGGVEGSSGGVEGSSASKVKSESPLDYVLELESLEFPSFFDFIE
jgi:hypothetical protein